MIVGESTGSANSSVRAGFALYPSQWMGGRIYLRNLFAALRTLPGSPIVPVLFTGQRNDNAAGEFPDTEIVHTPLLDRMTPAWFVRKVIAKTTSQDILLRNLLQRQSISIVSHSFQLGFEPGTRSAIKTIGWIADFQHVHLPEFFTPEECRLRDRQFESICGTFDKVIVSSECARADLRAVLPRYAHKAELLRFVASPPATDEAASLAELQRLYGFEGPYFLLPNQFWAHKNHRVVLTALRELKRQGRPYLVLATGATKDYRNPAFFPSLMKYAEDCGVQDWFRVLGQIPFGHLAGLMRHAVAFINPSQFEGWSTSVEEVKSMGKQMVLSDLPVHREQAPRRGLYFPPQDAEALAVAMTTAYDRFEAGSDEEEQEAARVRFPERQRAFGEAYLQIVQRTLEDRAVSI